MFETVGNYSVKYQLRNGTSGSATVYTSSASVTLQDLVPNAEYDVSVAAINSCGGTSTFTMATFALQGNSMINKRLMFQYSVILTLTPAAAAQFCYNFKIIAD